jgi:hypothetical protein
VLICPEKKVLLADCWWLVCYERKYYWLVADKPNQQGGGIKHVRIQQNEEKHMTGRSSTTIQDWDCTGYEHRSWRWQVTVTGGG